MAVVFTRDRQVDVARSVKIGRSLRPCGRLLCCLAVFLDLLEDVLAPFSFKNEARFASLSGNDSHGMM